MNSLEAGSGYPPFRSELITNEFKPDKENILQFEDDPEVIVRKNEIAPDPSEQTPFARTIADFNYGKALFQDLSTKYHIHIPPINHVIGADSEGTPTMYTVTAKIHGESITNLLTKESLPPELPEQLAELYSNLAHYFIDTFNTPNAYLTDITKNSQYVLGKKKGDSEDSFYLVDIDPLYSKAPLNINWEEPEPIVGFRQKILSEIEQIINALRSTEGQLDLQLQLPRQTLGTFLESLKTDSNYAEKADYYLQLLDNTK